jgi:hypothetical protein
MALQDPIALEFQRRRRATWRAIRWWLFAAAVGLLALVYIAAHPFDANTTRIGSVILLMVSVCLFISYVQIRRLYRCPRCNEVPTRTAFGWADEFGVEPNDVQWNPAECPGCRVRFR